MIVCLCNAFCDKKLDSALQSGAASVSAAFACLGCSPVCGGCVPYIRERISEESASRSCLPEAACAGYNAAVIATEGTSWQPTPQIKTLSPRSTAS